ncbi:MAG: amino acid/polyamine/organocation transporter, superfamily [Ilumatobacteraceae bacterium]|nr:amino acid/polyamine/organocation transporter, superfamily [Ilumatobacteraceae bacterium]
MAHLFSTFKRVLVGKPLASSELGHQRLGKLVGLAVFSSDAVASTAFASEEILQVLVPAIGVAAVGYLLPISIVVVVLLVIVVASYRQTIFAYPGGGGSYIVSRENLGTTPSLVAGASLLVDYTLNVAVSAAAGVAALTSAVSGLRGHPVALSLGLVALITIANLRGVKESGRLFAGPVYGYVVAMLLLVGVGLARTYIGHLGPIPRPSDPVVPAGALEAVTLLLLLRAFASGAIALSGVEAISNGVPTFRAPETKNAATTLLWTGTILGSLFFGIALLAGRLKPTLSQSETILSQMGRAVFGSAHNPGYILLQASTVAILCLSANTSFADFPRLSSIIANDGYLPHQLANRGDRLVYSNGIIALSLASAGLLIGFNGNVTKLVPLFAVGLFCAFTLSQTGMVFHHLREREPRWHLNIVFNGIGAVACFVVLLVVVISKFTEGAWVPTVVIPLIVVLFAMIKRHYDSVDRTLQAVDPAMIPVIHHTVVIPVGRITPAVLQAIGYARAMKPDHVVAVKVINDETSRDDIAAAWGALTCGIPLEIIESPYRDLAAPIMDYLDRLDAEFDNDLITVLIPELVVHRWWAQTLHNQSALALKARLLFRPNTAVTSLPIHTEAGERRASAPGGGAAS